MKFRKITPIFFIVWFFSTDVYSQLDNKVSLSFDESSGSATVFIVNENLFGMGGEAYGKLGLASGAGNDFIKEPTLIAQNVRHVDMGSRHTVFINKENQAFAMGQNAFGSLGLGNTQEYQIPVMIMEDVKYATVSDLGQNITILKNDSTVWVAGEFFDTKRFIKVAENVLRVEFNGELLIILKNDNSLWYTGLDRFGASRKPPTSFIQYPNFEKISDNIKDFDLSSTHMVYLDQSNNLYGVGDNSKGALGTQRIELFDDYPITWTPILIDSNVERLKVSYHSTMYSKIDGTTWATGLNDNHQITNNTTFSNVFSPLNILDSAIDLMIGTTHSVYLDSLNSIYLRGLNNQFQLGFDEIDRSNEWISPLIIDFKINDLIFSSNLRPNRSTDFEFKLTNNGVLEDEQKIYLLLNDNRIDSLIVSIKGKTFDRDTRDYLIESKYVKFEWNTPNVKDSTYSFQIFSNQDSINFNINIKNTPLRVPSEYLTIQEAIDNAISGDTILIAPGEYETALFIEKKSINLVSESGYDSTIIKLPSDAQNLIQFDGGFDWNSGLFKLNIDGVTLVGGDLNSKLGTAISTQRNASTDIKNSVIKYFSVAMRTYYGKYNIENSVFYENRHFSYNDVGFDDQIISVINTSILESEANITNTHPGGITHQFYNSIIANRSDNPLEGTPYNGSRVLLSNVASNFTYSSALSGSKVIKVSGAEELLLESIEQEQFALTKYSSAIGLGTPIDSIQTDILGNPRPNPVGSNPDIGAFENPLAIPDDLPAPSEVTVTDNEFSLDFTWVYNDTISPIMDHFEIHKADSLGSFSLLDTTSVYTFTDDDVVPGNEYSYMIRMVSSDERFSLYTDTLTITVEDQAPSIPMTFTSKLLGVKEITLMWEPNSEPDIQIYELSKQSAGETISVLDSLTEASYVDSVGLDELTNYVYSLIAVDNGGNKSEPVYLTQRTGDETIPSVPNGLIAEASPGQVLLSWTANNETDLWKYLIYRGSDSTQVALIDSVDSNETNYFDQSVVNAKTYYYRISALDSVNGNPEISFDPALESELSSAVKALPPDLEGPGKPEIISSSSFNKTVNFSWNPLDAGDLDFYHVYRGINESTLNIIDSVYTTSYSDLAVSNGITYYYAVTGIDTVGNEGERSNIVSATPTNALPRVSTYSSLVFNNIGNPIFEYDAAANASDADGSIDSTFWFVNGVLSSTSANPTLELEQGTSELTLRVMDNDGGMDAKSFKIHVNAGYRLFEDGMSDGAGISMIGTDYVFIPIQGGTMQILDGGFQDRNTLSVGGEIKNVSSIAQDTTVYLASSDKVVYTFNRLGIPVWNTPLGGELEATPTIDVSRDLVYVGVSNNNLFAINRSTGSVVWSNRLDSPISQPGVIIEDKYLLIITTGGTVYYFDLDGEVSSQVLAPEGILSIGENIISAPALDAAGYLYLASTTGTIRKFEFRDDLPNKGQVIWEVNTQSEFYTSPVIGYDGTVYVGGADSTLYALNGQNSSLKWSKKLGAAISTTATINEYGVLYIGDSDGTIYAMSDTGEPIWYYETGSEIGNATAYADGHLYFATADGELLKVYDGWRFEGIQGKTTWVSKAPQWGTYQGNFRRSGNLSEASVINSVEPLEELPQDYALSQNYPNPFNPSTKINYSLPEATRVSLDIFNMLGQKVATLVDAQQSAGYHTASFDASQLSSGVYLYKLSAPGFSQTKKMLLIK